MSHHNAPVSEFGSLALGHSGSSSGDDEGGNGMPAVTRSQTTTARQAGASSATATMMAGRSMAARRGTAATPATPSSTIRRAPAAHVRYAQTASRAADSSDEDDDEDDDEDEEEEESCQRRARDVLAYFEPDKMFISEAFDLTITQRSPESHMFARLGHALSTNVQSAASLAAVEASLPAGHWYYWATSRVKQTIAGELKKYHDGSIDIVTSVELLVRVVRECTYLLKNHPATTAAEMAQALVTVLWFIVNGDQHVSPNPGYVGGAHEHNLYRRFVSQPAAWMYVLRRWGQTLEEEAVLAAFRLHATPLREMWGMVSARHQQATPEENEYRFRAEFGLLVARIAASSPR